MIFEQRVTTIIGSNVSGTKLICRYPKNQTLSEERTVHPYRKMCIAALVLGCTDTKKAPSERSGWTQKKTIRHVLLNTALASSRCHAHTMFVVCPHRWQERPQQAPKKRGESKCYRFGHTTISRRSLPTTAQSKAAVDRAMMRH